MTHFADVGNWADAHITPADQARLFLRIDKLAPKRHRSYLRGLLGSIVPSQRWGIAPVAQARDFHIMFKGGWRTNISHQVALLERDGAADGARRPHPRSERRLRPAHRDRRRGAHPCGTTAAPAIT